MAPPFWIETHDWHTAGEPFRIVPTLPENTLPLSSTVPQRRLDILAVPNHPLDQLRRSLCHEPRGHADMYGGFITPPNDDGALFGVLFFHKDGFSTACGHGTIALGYWALHTGKVKAPENGQVDVVVDCPSGRVVARMGVENGKAVHADFINVMSYQLFKGLSATIPSLDKDLSVDLTFGGAVYATLDAAQVGLQVKPGNVDKFIQYGREIKAALGERAHYNNYDCYGVIFFDEVEDGEGVVKQRNVTVFADGQIDRSPCGSGSCARLAVLVAQGRLDGQGKLINQSIIESTFEARAHELVKGPGEFPAVMPVVRGRASLVGEMKFYIDEADELHPGFLLR